MEIKNTHQTRPPGPSYFSLMGELITNRLDFYSELRDKYGDIVKVPNIVRAYLVNDPHCLEHILKTHSYNYQKGGTATLALKATLGNGLLVNEGEEWKKRRRLTAPYFQPKNLHHFTPIVHEYTAKRLRLWQDYSKNQIAFDIAKEMMKIIFNITAKAFYSIEVDEKKLEKIVHAIHLENKFSTSGLVLVPWLPTINGFRYRHAKNFLQKFLLNIIKDREQSSKKYQDLLEIIMHATLADNKTPLSKQEIFDEAKTFLMTGHETTGSALGWTMYLLAKHPEAQTKIRKELKLVLNNKPPEYEDCFKLDYTRCVFEEALRLYPPIWMTGRKVIADDWLNNFYIQAGSEIYICPYTMHRHPHYWDNPNSFYPERHSLSQQQQRPRFAFIPFGGGPRICIASHFAVLEGIMIIALILRQYSLELVEEHPIELDHFISLKPRYGVKVRVKEIPEN